MGMMQASRQRAGVGTAVLLAAGAAAVFAATDSDKIAIEEQLALMQKLEKSVVVVEYRLRYDAGRAPEGAEVQYVCPFCGRIHTRNEGKTVIEQQRPLETAGYVLAPSLIVAGDVPIHDRFIERIDVRRGDTRVPARAAAYCVHEDAVFIELEEPLPDSVPLEFHPDAGDPCLTLNYEFGNGEWRMTAEPIGFVVTDSPGVDPFLSVKPGSLIVDKSGAPAGLTMNGRLDPDGSWKGSPRNWERVSTEAIEQRLSELREIVANGFFRVQMHFRSPKADKTDPYSMFRRYTSYGEEDGAVVTELNGLGILCGKNQVLVLSELEPRTTARLERVAVWGPDGEAHEADFAGSLEEYGGLIVSLKEPVGRPLAFSEEALFDLWQDLLLKATVGIAGEEKFAYYGRDRIGGCKLGFEGKVYPDIKGAHQNAFLFSMDGRLVVLPVSVRERVRDPRQGRWRQNEPLPTWSRQIGGLLAHVPAGLDPNNAPLSEEKEGSVGWLGVVLQPMTKELAQAHRVSEQTQNGKTGALITLVYPGSPAAAAGLKAGMVLLRIHAEGIPQPVDIVVEQDQSYGFDWSQIDMIPAQFMDRIPAPWPHVANAFTRLLTGIGIGKSYTADLAVEGEIIAKELTIVESPPHYGSAARFESEALGITVRDLTFEVRQNLRKSDDDPGVVVSKIEEGGAAAVAGVVPHELITHVNGEPVASVEAFERFVAEAAVLRLSLDRMGHTRQVKMTLESDRGRQEENGPDEPAPHTSAE